MDDTRFAAWKAKSNEIMAGVTPCPKFYRVTSLVRNRHSVGPYSRTMPRVLGGS